jgi:hypothetical protein
LTINYEATKAYSMMRSRNWWNAGLISVYQVPNPDIFRPPYKPETFFSARTGLLNMLPSTAVVGFRSSIEMTISKTNYSLFKMDIEGKGEISIGPFKLNANATYTSTKENKENESVTVSYKGNANTPILFGVFSEIHVL